jgi:hypothetical protein
LYGSTLNTARMELVDQWLSLSLRLQTCGDLSSSTNTYNHFAIKIFNYKENNSATPQ